MVLILDSGHGGSSVLMGCGDHGEGLKFDFGYCMFNVSYDFLWKYKDEKVIIALA